MGVVPDVGRIADDQERDLRVERIAGLALLREVVLIEIDEHAHAVRAAEEARCAAHDQLARGVDQRPAAVPVGDGAVGLHRQALRLREEGLGDHLLAVLAGLLRACHLGGALRGIAAQAVEAREHARVLLALADARHAAGLRGPPEADAGVTDRDHLLRDLRRALRELDHRELRRGIDDLHDRQIAHAVGLHHHRVVGLLLAAHATGGREIAEGHVDLHDEVLLRAVRDDVVVGDDVAARIEHHAGAHAALAADEHGAGRDQAVGLVGRQLGAGAEARGTGLRRLGGLVRRGRRRGHGRGVAQQLRELRARRAEARGDPLADLALDRRARRGGRHGRLRGRLLAPARDRHEGEHESGGAALHVPLHCHRSLYPSTPRILPFGW